jgi:hypothetical protein
MNNNNNQENRIQYYIQYLSSWFYHNVLYTETAATLLKIIVFVILLSLLVYQKYYYFAAGAAGAALASVYLFTRPGGGAEEGAAVWPWPWPGMMDNAVRRVDKDELTTGVALVKEGFSIGMPKIIKGDDTGKDYHRSNKFIEEDSRDFTEKYFNSKKCGIGSGIGGITMFGSNELIGGARTVALAGLYDFAGNWGGVSDINGTTTAINQKRYKYFKDCVFIPVKKSVDSSGNDFRNIKKTMFANINTKIMNINGVLGRFDTTLLFNTQTGDSNADYSKRISLSSNTSNTGNTNNIAYKSLITGADNKAKLENIQPLTNKDSINDKIYAELLTSINNDRAMTSSVRQRHLEVYAKVYEYRKKIDNILANMRAQTKDDASLLYTVRVNESVISEIRLILSYLAIIQRTNDIIQFETRIGTGNNGSIYNLAPIGLPATYEMGPILNTEGENKSKIVGANNNIFKIPLEDDTYNNNDEKRYVYGITYYFDTTNSNRD